jgi:DNA-binding response OmpR family regulator
LGDAKRVVIVDDEEDIVTYLAALLTDNGYEVWTATDGREGLGIIRDTKPDLVCLDILMPGETGLSLFRKIRTDSELERLPVIIISGMSYSGNVSGGSGPEAWDIAPPEAYIEKPVKPGPFLEAVKAVIG